MTPVAKLLTIMGLGATAAVTGGVIEHYSSKKSTGGGGAGGGSGDSSGGGGGLFGGGEHPGGSSGGVVGGKSHIGGFHPGGQGQVVVGGISQPGLITSATVTLQDGTTRIAIPSITSAGAMITVNPPPTGGKISTVVADGFDAGSTTAMVNHSSGTVLVTWVDAAGAPMTTAINYGTLPAQGPQQTVTIPSNGAAIYVSGAGVPDTPFLIMPPDSSVEFVAPYGIDETTVDFQTGQGYAVGVRTLHWSGVVRIGWIADNQAVNALVYYGP